jgi:hypothetical protein
MLLYKKRQYPPAGMVVLAQQLNDYMDGTGRYCRSYGGPGFMVRNWWADLMGKQHYLAELAVVLYDIVPSAADVERAFSMMGWYGGGRRNALSVTRTTQLSMCRQYYLSQAPRVVKASRKPSTSVKPGALQLQAPKISKVRIPGQQQQAAAAEVMEISDDDEQQDGEEAELRQQLADLEQQQQGEEDAEQLIADDELGELLDDVAGEDLSDELPTSMSTDELLGGTAVLETGAQVVWLWLGFDWSSALLLPGAEPPLVVMQAPVAALGAVADGEYDIEQHLDQVQYRKANTSALGA